MPKLYQILTDNTDFQNYITVRIRRKFVIVLSLKSPQQLKCVATLPCEMSVSLKQQLKTLVSGVAGLRASSSSKADTLNILV